MSWTEIICKANIPSCTAKLTTTMLIPNLNAKQGSSSCVQCGDSCNPPPPDKPLCGLENTLLKRDYNRSTTYDSCECDSSIPVHCKREYNVKVDWNDTCGTLDWKTMLTLGQSNGTCRGNCCAYSVCEKVEEKDWDWEITDWKTNKGWMYCTFEFDYSSFTLLRITDLFNWTNDIIKGKNLYMQNGLDPKMSAYLLNINFVYATIYDYYNQLYMFGPYNKTNLPIFSGINYLSVKPEDFNKRLLNNYSIYEGLFPDGTFPENVKEFINQTLTYPSFPSETEIDYNISYTIYQKALEAYGLSPGFAGSQEALDSFFNSLLSYFFRDEQGQLYKDVSVSSSPITPNKIVIKNSVIKSLNLVSIDGNYYKRTLNIKIGDDLERMIPADFFISSFTVSSSIVSWSILAYNLYKTYSFVTVEKPTFLEKVLYDTLLCPLSLYNTYKTKILKRDAIEKYCKTGYDFPSFLTGSNSFFINKNSDICECYLTKVAPVGISNIGNRDGMCFDTACKDYTDLFNLSEQSCVESCQTVNNWIHADNEGLQPRNATRVDTARVQKLCGDNYKPYSSKTFNIGIFICFMVITVLISLTVFAVYKNYKETTDERVNSFWAVIYGIIIFIVCTGLSVFLGFDLAGKPDEHKPCDKDNNFVCMSRLTKRRIPTEFCGDNILNCECQSDQDCPDGCSCYSSSCLPKSGVRATKDVVKKIVNKPFIAISVMILFLFPIALFYLYKDYHYPVNAWLYMGVVIVLASLPLLYFIRDAMKGKTVKEFTGSCLGFGKCNSDSDCSNSEDKGGDNEDKTDSKDNPSFKCVNRTCVKEEGGCPISLNTKPPVSLKMGVYTIKYQGMYLTVGGDNSSSSSSFQNTSPVLVKPKSDIESVWTYDHRNNTLYSTDVNGDFYSMAVKDACTKKNCQGVVYSEPYSDYPNRFILGDDNTIFSLEANAYLIPDLRPCILEPCPLGRCLNDKGEIYYHVSYTVQPSLAKVWEIVSN
jgi:hypothetical protein